MISPDHPRVGGEHILISMYSFHVSGSSPRGRGTRNTPITFLQILRIIPAWARNTNESNSRRIQRTDHPRVGGEHGNAASQSIQGVGSSPRGRGTLTSRPRGGYGVRIIPAWAGNTDGSKRCWLYRPDHPRVGGEHSCSIALGCGSRGSSPRGRGTLLHRIVEAGGLRIIPAWAGNTEGSTPIPARSLGSSPRGRGTPDSPPTITQSSRIIPAWAGNTSKMPMS